MSGRKHRCPACGQQALRRIERVGFLKKHIYPVFGYYPWECPQCRRKLLLRSRGQRSVYKRSASAPANASKHPAQPAADSQNIHTLHP